MQIRSKTPLWLAWGFAILWNLLAAPATLLGAAPAIRKGPGVAWVALVFPIAGAMLLLRAMRLTLRVRRFGTSLFEMAGDAATAGEPLRGTITARNLPQDAALRLTLAASDIREMRLKVGMQSGSTPLYDIVLDLASGGRSTVSAMLRDRREAEWLAGAIRCSLSR